MSTPLSLNKSQRHSHTHAHPHTHAHTWRSAYPRERQRIEARAAGENFFDPPLAIDVKHFEGPDVWREDRYKVLRLGGRGEVECVKRLQVGQHNFQDRGNVATDRAKKGDAWVGGGEWKIRKKHLSEQRIEEGG